MSEPRHPTDFADRERSGSSLSISSTLSAASTTHDEHTRSHHTSYVEAFCMMNGWIIEVPYPRPESGWTYRFDLGSNSQHRWDYVHSLVLTVRHTTCTKGLFKALPCRNCFMKQKWRRECCNPSNIWFIQASHNPGDAVDALRSLINMSTARQADRPTIEAHLRIVPKTQPRKKIIPTHARVVFLMKLEMQLTGMNNSGHFLPRPPGANEGDLLNLMSEALGLDEDDEYTSTVNAILDGNEPLMSSFLHDNSFTLLVEDGSIKGPAPSPLRSALGVQAPEKPVLGTLAVMPDIRRAYDSLLEAVHTHQEMGQAVLSASLLSSILSSFPDMYTNGTQEAYSHMLDRILGVPQTYKLLLKSLLPVWLTRAVARSSASDGWTTISLGYYYAPNETVFRQIVKDAVLPDHFARGIHRIHTSLDAILAVEGVHPILVVVLNVNADVHGPEILPLSVIWRTK